MAGNGMKGKGARILSAPLIVNWSLSFLCNFDCRHCYSRSEKSAELDTGQVLEAGERLARAGVLFANFGGGEPLLRRDLGGITRSLTDFGLFCSMNSNGWLLDDAAAEMVKDAGFASVGLSMDSHLAEAHDEFRSRPGSFARVQEAAERLGSRHVPLTVSTVISRLNHRDLTPIIELVRTMGAVKLYLHNFKCSGRGFENRSELDLSPPEWKEFYREALDLAEVTGDLEISFDDPILASLDGGRRDDAAPGSSCGKMSLHLRPNGDFTPCGFIPLVLGNVLRDDFSDMWKNSPVLEEMRGKSAKGKCRSCGHYAECLGGCTARAYAMTGDLNAPDPHCWVGEEES
jgi:GeoRSP system radical SAM/SPASM protein